jgi:hypothetical protein
MIVSYIAFVVALAAVIWAWSLYRKNGELKERIAQVNSRVYHLRREMLEAQEKAGLQFTELKFQLLQLKGELKVTPEMKIGEVVTLHPQAQQVLAGFHLGGCSSCSVDNNQSLAEAAALNSRELSPILVALNGLLAESAGDRYGPVPAEGLKTPNVELHF